MDDPIPEPEKIYSPKWLRVLLTILDPNPAFDFSYWTPQFFKTLAVLGVIIGIWFGYIFFVHFFAEEKVYPTFTPRPSSEVSTEGQFCGGIAVGQFPCPEGYTCKLDGDYLDASGKCVKN